MKKAAVEWLYNHLFPNQLDGFSDEEWSKIDLAFEKAKQMEKQQIIDAYVEGGRKGFNEFADDYEQYYNETFNKP